MDPEVFEAIVRRGLATRQKRVHSGVTSLATIDNEFVENLKRHLTEAGLLAAGAEVHWHKPGYGGDVACCHGRATTRTLVTEDRALVTCERCRAHPVYQAAA